MATEKQAKPYIIRTYDRWIILALVLVASWLLFRPLFAYSVYYRGVSFERLLALHTAEHYYRKAISVDAHIPEPWEALGQLYLMRARGSKEALAGAIDTYSRGSENNPKNGQLPFGLCRAYFEAARDYQKALVWCKRSAKVDPSFHFAWDYAGWASFKVGDRAHAALYWRESLKRAHNPAVEEALRKYAPKGG
jgi:tetratricopeptide (TPR) repeat protein